MRHVTNELSFEKPAGLHDRTHHILAVAPDGPSPLTIVISRHPIDRAETLAGVADRVLAELARALDDFTLLSRGSATVADQDAVVLQFRWRQGADVLFQKQAAFFLDDEPSGRQLVQIAATAGEAATAAQVAMLDTVLATLRLREAEPD